MIGRLPSKVVFPQKSSSIKDRLPSKVVFHQRSSSIKSRLPSKVVFRQRSSSIKANLPSKVIFHCMKHDAWWDRSCRSESSKYMLGCLDKQNWIRNEKQKDRKTERISTCRSRAYYVSAGQKFQIDLFMHMGARLRLVRVYAYGLASTTFKLRLTNQKTSFNKREKLCTTNIWSWSWS